MMKIVEDADPRCPVCGTRKVRRVGFRFRSTTQDQVADYKCGRCSTSFVAGKGGYRGRKRDGADIDRVIELAKEGLTYGEIGRTLYHEQGKPISRETVQRWVVAFAPEYAHEGYANPEPEPRYLAAVRGKAKALPVIHLSDLGKTRRVVYGPEMRKIARHPKVPFRTDVYHILHSPVRGPNVHDSSMSVKQSRRLARYLGWSMEKLEKHAVTLYSGRSGHSRPQKVAFPLRANGGFAFLMGLFYASGGVGESELHFAVDKEVGLYLQNEVAKEVGEVPTLRSQGSRVIGKMKFDTPKAYGSRHVVYTKVVQEELELFGLKTRPPIRWKRGKPGKYIPSRHLTMGIPMWVRRNPPMLHRFVEGYINGLKICCELKGILDDIPRRESEGKNRRRSHLTTVTKVAVRFCNRKPKEMRAFARPFIRHMERLGVTGWFHDARQDGRTMKHCEFNFHTLPQLRNFRENFLMLRPMVKTKMDLMLAREDPIVRKITQRIDGYDGFVVGMLMEGPKTLKELADRCPKRPYNMTTEDVLRPSVEKLVRLGVVRHGRGRGVWVYDPRRFAKNLAKGYLNEFEFREGKIASLKNGDIFVCRPCGTVGDVATCERCGKPRQAAGAYELRRLRNNKAKFMADELMEAAS